MIVGLKLCVDRGRSQPSRLVSRHEAIEIIASVRARFVMVSFAKKKVNRLLI